MTVIGEAFVAIRALDGGVAGDAEKIVTPALSTVAKKGAEIVGGLAIGRVAVHQFAEGIEELKDSEAVAAQTATAIESTGGAARVSAEHVGELAEAGLKLAGVDDELIGKGENILLSFTKVANQGEGTAAIFDRATRAGLDLATRGFGSVESNAKLLGIALSDPEAGLTKLRRAGITLTEQQQASIKEFAAQNNLLAEQEVLLDAVEGKVGGAAEAYGKTLGGQVKIAEESIKNARAEIVASAAPALVLFAGLATSAAGAVQEMPGPLRDTVAGLGLVAVGFTAVAKPISAAVDLIQLFRPAQEAATVATQAATAADVEKAAATEVALAADGEAALAAAGLAGANQAVAVTAEEAAVAELEMEAAALPLIGTIALVAAGAAILAGVGVALVSALEDNVQAADEYAEALDKATGATEDNVNAITAQELIASSAYDTLKGLGVASGDIFNSVTKGTQNWGEYSRALDRARTSGVDHASTLRALDRDLRGAGAGQDALSSAILDGLASGDLSIGQADKLVEQLQGLHNGYDEATAKQRENAEAEKVVADAHAAAGQQYVLEADAIDQVTKAHEEYLGLIDQLAAAQDRTYQATTTNTRLAITYQAKIDDLTGTIKENGDTLDDNTEKGRKNLTTALDAGESIAKLIERRFQETHSIEEATAAGDLYVANLEEQLRQAGLTDEQVRRYIETMNLTPDQIDTIFSNNALEQQIVVGKYLAQLDTVPAELRSQIETEIEQGHLDEVNRALDDLAQGRTVVFTPAFEEEFVSVDSSGHVIKRRAGGGPVYAGEMYEVNEGGRREFFRPAVDGIVLSADQANQERLGGLATMERPAPGGDVVHVQVDARGNPDGLNVGRRIGEGIDDHRWRFPHR